MLTTALIEQVLTRAGSLTIGVLGDLFLDRYLDLDGSLTEPSLETGLDAYQVVNVRSYPGAAGTVINNLAALGVGRVVPIAVIGDDGEGYELRRALAAMPCVDASLVYAGATCRTPTYTKPMLTEPGQPARELNRLDIKNRTRTPAEMTDRVIAAIRDSWKQLDAVIVVDQVSELDCGVVTGRVREALQSLAADDPARFILADSRERIGEFHGPCIKPNAAECRSLTGCDDVHEAAQQLAQRNGRPVFCTVGADGMVLALPNAAPQTIAGFPVEGPTDPVGAGDCASAAIAAAVASGLEFNAAAAFGCLAASISVQQLGTTGTANAGQVRSRWRQLCP